MKKQSELNVPLHKIEQKCLDSIFPEELSESDLLTFLKFSTEQAADEVFWMRSDSEIFYVNDAACKKLGYERHELIGMRVWEWDPLFPREVWPTFWEEVREKKHVDFETKHQTKKGRVFPVKIKGHYFKHGEEEILFAYVSDISDIKEQEAKLEDRSKHLESLVDQRTAELQLEKKKFEEFVNLAPVGIAINRIEDGNFVYINSEFSRFTGYSVDELNAMDYWELTPKEYEEQEHEQLVSMAGTGGYGPYQKEYIHKKGHHYPVLLSGIKITDLDGKEYIWSVVQDISMQEKSKEALREAKNEALELAKVKSQFLANMSHEIRTPMNGIVGLTNLLLHSPLNSEQQQWAEGVKTSADSLLTIINDILDISKIESGKLKIESIPFSMVEMLHQTLQPLKLVASNKSIGFEIHTDGFKHSRFVGDPIRIKQIITNLVNNAIKFTESGTVSLSVEKHPSVLDKHCKFVFTVSDTGIGISPEVMDSLFQRFSQADSSTTRRFGGTGLGLNICKQLAELMGGQIGCESKAGEGSKFWFSLDLELAPDENNVQEVEPQKEEYSLSSQGLKILLVEDVKINQMVAESILQELGMESELAENGLEAVQMVKENRYDAVLMDCHMPVMDGFEATAEIRKLPECENLPIIALTAGAMKEEYNKCIESGMNTVITKPYEPEDIVQAISTYVPSR